MTRRKRTFVRTKGSSRGRPSSRLISLEICDWSPSTRTERTESRSRERDRSRVNTHVEIRPGAASTRRWGRRGRNSHRHRLPSSPANLALNYLAGAPMTECPRALADASCRGSGRFHQDARHLRPANSSPLYNGSLTIMSAVVPPERPDSRDPRAANQDAWIRRSDLPAEAASLRHPAEASDRWETSLASDKSAITRTRWRVRVRLRTYHKIRPFELTFRPRHWSWSFGASA